MFPHVPVNPPRLNQFHLFIFLAESVHGGPDAKRFLASRFVFHPGRQKTDSLLAGPARKCPKSANCRVNGTISGAHSPERLGPAAAGVGGRIPLARTRPPRPGPGAAAAARRTPVRRSPFPSPSRIPFQRACVG